MLAARLDTLTHRLVLEDVPVPEPGPGQVRIAVAAAGVCLSDVHLLQGSLTPFQLHGTRVTLGHEVAGTVDALGASGTGTLRVGQRVMLEAGEDAPDGSSLTRGVDYDGGWAEYALATASTVVPIPDSLPFEQAAVIPDAVSTPWGAITETARVRPAEAVGVWGAGGLGAHAVQLLRAVGAAPIVVVDPHAPARRRALDLGADLAFDPEDPALSPAVAGATARAGLAVAFDFAGVAAARRQAVRLLGEGGRLVLVGLTDGPLTVANGTAFSFRRQQVLGHYGYGPGTSRQLLRMVATGRLEFSRSVSAVLPLARAAEAVERLETKQGDPIRIVLRP